MEITVNLRRPHAKQREFIDCQAPRIVVRAGRRSGKTTGIGVLAVREFLDNKRVLYAAPTAEQIDRFWFEVKRALAGPIDAGVLYKNESRHIIEIPGTEFRIRAKTAWNADTLRGDYADFLVLDEWQLMDEDAWGRVGAPMLIDNNGRAVFIYTPPSLHSRSISKARDPLHAAKLFATADADTSGRWATFHFTSLDNPHISHQAVEELAGDMTTLAYDQEILALDKTEVPGALWRLADIEDNRVAEAPELHRIGIGVDPPGGATECGIIVAGVARAGQDLHGYILADYSGQMSPERWARMVADAYTEYSADRVFAERNFGGDMVEATLRAVAPDIPLKLVNASRGKAVRAEPIAAHYQRGRVHHVGSLPNLEEEMTSWVPGMSRQSPNRIDALVWVLTELMGGGGFWSKGPTGH